MYCVNCGHGLPDDANFCSHCGTPQAVESDLEPNNKFDVAVDAERWETCQISLKVVKSRFLGGSDLQFEVRGVGPEGKYLVATSEKWTGRASQRDREADRIHWQ